MGPVLRFAGVGAAGEGEFLVGRLAAMAVHIVAGLAWIAHKVGIESRYMRV